MQKHVEVIINSSLSLNTDVTSAKALQCNKKPKKVFQGQTHGHEGFLLTKEEGIKLLKKNPEYKNVLKPFLVGEELVGNKNAQPGRFVIDFSQMDILKASTYKDIFKIIEKIVLPEREARGKEQEDVNKELLKNDPKAKINKHHINFYKNWWMLSYGREDMLNERSNLKRYISCARVTQRPIFEFFENYINPNDKVMAFMFEDDYSFGIIQSGIHWKWFLKKCTTLGQTPNYNSAAIWDTFPWPQTPTEVQIKKVAAAAKAFHIQRTATLKQYNMSLRDLYRLLEQPGANPIKDLHAALDKAVMEAYGFDDTKDILAQLLALNLLVADKENRKEKVQAPGLPEFVKNKEDYVSDECVRFEWG
ncbi:type IIL restriction-modification enzyme MmeI [Ferruginibacter sp.]